MATSYADNSIFLGRCNIVPDLLYFLHLLSFQNAMNQTANIFREGP